MELLLNQLDFLGIEKVCFYLDAPVSNSGRLSALIRECARNHGAFVTVEVINDVDRVLQKLEGVITADAIILNHCVSWLNIVPKLIGGLDEVWLIQLQ